MYMYSCSFDKAASTKAASTKLYQLLTSKCQLLEMASKFELSAPVPKCGRRLLPRAPEIHMLEIRNTVIL